LRFINNAHREAVKDLTGEDFNPVPDFKFTKPAGPGQAWAVDEALKVVKGKSDFERGRSPHASTRIPQRYIA
jgi:hypothetical protein